jgi:hypothetical protein
MSDFLRRRDVGKVALAGLTAAGALLGGSAAAAQERRRRRSGASHPLVSRAGSFLLTFKDMNRPYAVGLPYGNWTADYPEAFRGATPVRDFIGSDAPGFPIFFAIDANNAIYAAGLPGGQWVNDFLPAPDFTPDYFLGTGGDYLAVMSDGGTPYVIGGLNGAVPRGTTTGATRGRWVEARNLQLP